MPEADGLESIVLAKPWLDRSAGETVRVDPLRAMWMRENGYGAPETVETGTAPESGTVHPDFPGLRIGTELSEPNPDLGLESPPVVPDLSLPKD